MFIYYKTHLIIPFFLAFFFQLHCVELMACDKNISGPVAAPNNIINSGETGCITGDFSGSITVNPGGELRICGQYTFLGSINVASGAKVVITSGSSIGVNGSLTFNDFESLEFVGDPSCNAEIYAITFNSCFVTWGAVPGTSGVFCNSSNVYLDGFNFAWGAGTIGLARTGRAPSLCASGGVFACEVLLPINTLDFDAQQLGQSVFLEWTTAQGVGPDYYTIERSIQALEWEQLDTLHAQASSSNIYQFIDPIPHTGGTYYRIRQTDIDGTSSVSAIKYVSGVAPEYNFSVSPNPSSGKFALSFSSLHGFHNFKVLDRIGNIVRQGTLDQNLRQDIDLTNLNNGVYFLIIKGQREVISQRIVLFQE